MYHPEVSTLPDIYTQNIESSIPRIQKLFNLTMSPTSVVDELPEVTVEVCI